LRIIGLLLVLVYHFFGDSLPGGFLGVDVFFTISGYLITAHMVHQYETTGSVRLFAFYKRRFRRLLPAVLFMLAVVLPASLLVSPDFRAGIDRQIAAVLGWITNYFEIAVNSSYENKLLPHLFMHTWTLGVDVHYYLVWSVVIRCLVFFRGKPSEDKPAAAFPFYIVLAVLAAAAAAASYLVMRNLLAASGENPSRAYFATESHAYPLMIGSLTALFAGFGENSLIRIIGKLGVVFPVCILLLEAGGIVLMARLLNFEDPAVYQWGILAASLLTSGGIVVLRGMQDNVEREPAFLKYIADRSFSVYLFHWPLYIIIGQFPRIPHLPAVLKSAFSNDVGVAVFTAALSAILAHVSYLLVEKRFCGNSSRDAEKSPWDKIIPALLGIVLFLGYWYAVRTAPRKTSIEQGFEHETLLLDTDDLYRAEESLKDIRVDPVLGRDIEWQPSKPFAGWMPVITNRSLASNFGTVTVIGDSVLLGTSKTLRDYVRAARIDAEGSRNISQGARIVTALKREGRLGEYVVLILATNKVAGDAEIAERIVQNIGPGHRIIFVTGHGNKSTLPLNRAYRSLAEKYPYVTVADWDAAISPFEYLLSTDNIHMGDPASKRIFAQCIVDALERAKEKPASGGGNNG
jgi:peptidoglycan/LPS O-acetylase OafA/YrhL